MYLNQTQFKYIIDYTYMSENIIMVHSTKSPSVSGSSPHLDEVRSSIVACSEYAIPKEQASLEFA